ncbi:MAG: glycosyl hydrolase-related protein [Clostridiales bacterium]|nr:glycosyl hydrolase-related protein [Clostridiales bacterium]
MSFLKRSENGEGFILRLWNPGKTGQVKINSGLRIKELAITTLQENVLEYLNPGEGVFTLSAHGLITVFLRPMK